MRIDKRGLLEKLAEGDLSKRLSVGEMRLYLLLIIVADGVGGGRLTSRVLKQYLESNFLRNQLEKAVHHLENLHLAKLDISWPGPEIEFELVREERSASKSRISPRTG